MRVASWCFFFFQAEDGIRDPSVTGVQTCALPISLKVPVFLLSNYLVPKVRDFVVIRHPDDFLSLDRLGVRSEERRVGKECRSRWSRSHRKTHVTLTHIEYVRRV